MYLKNAANEVKEITEKINELDMENKLKFIIHAEESEKNNPLVTIEW